MHTRLLHVEVESVQRYSRFSALSDCACNHRCFVVCAIVYVCIDVPKCVTDVK